MKTIGIVRRVDDLGRIVIPKELRRTLGIDINEGTPLNIYIAEDENGERCIVMKVYEPREGDKI